MATTKNARPSASEKAKIKEKVAKLLAQSNDEGVTEQEAQTFAAKAAELMARHGLTEAVLREEKGEKAETVQRWDFEVSGQGWHGKARAHLVYSVAEAYGCSVCTIGNKMDGKDRRVAIVGTRTMITALKLLLPAILVQAERHGMAERKAHMAEVGGNFDSAASRNIESRTFYRSYLTGYGAGVAEKLAEGRRAMTDEVKGQPGELVLVSEQDRIAARFEQLFPNLKTGRADKVSVEGLAAGKRDGRNADTGGGKVTAKSGKALAR